MERFILGLKSPHYITPCFIIYCFLFDSRDSL